MKKHTRYRTLIPVYLLVLSSFLIIALAGNRAITVLSEQSPVTDQKTVIIDAGHGGVDGGATSCTGVLESQINLQIALRLDDLLHLLGIKTAMIRTTDISIYTHGTSIAEKKVSDLKERVRIVNNTENRILISIHQNYFSDSRYHGAQVFYAPTNGSKELADHMQQVFIQSINPTSHRQVKKADGVYLMQHIRCPGVLVECGFLSNPEEESLLRNEAYQKKLCCAIASTCSQFLQQNSQLT